MAERVKNQFGPGRHSKFFEDLIEVISYRMLLKISRRGFPHADNFRLSGCVDISFLLATTTGASMRDYFGDSDRFASSCTDFVVADLSIPELVERPHASGGFVICLANTRKLGPSGRNVDQYPDEVSNGL
jgi:hypothetical protein